MTVSASYGAGGSVVAPRLAERLGLALVDRLVTADVSEVAARDATAAATPAVAARSGEGLSEQERAASPGSRLFTYLARAATIGLSAPALVYDTEEDLRTRAEADLAGVLAGEGAVVLGRAGAVVLARRPRCLHVRLDGPSDRRLAAASQIEGVPADRAAQRMVRTDRARELWVRRLYQVDARDPSWYHLWIDTTIVGIDATVDLVAEALERAFPSGGA